MLTLSHVSKTFGRGTPNEKTVLQDFNLHLSPGEFVTVLGSNGTGKSSLFGAIAGSIPVDSGQILLDGTDITHQKEYRRAKQIGRLFQDPLKGTAPSMTIEENLRLAYMRHAKGHIKSAFYREQVAALGMGLEDRMHTKMGLLSGGQRQAITLLMTTMAAPKLLLLDEHSAALDPATAEQVLALTNARIAAHKITTLMITHSIAAALTLGTRTIMLDGGRVALDLTGEARRAMTEERILTLFREKYSAVG